MAKGFAIGWGVILAIAVNSPAVQSQETVAALAGRLQLTEAGVGRWLQALGVAPGRPSTETLLVVSADGRVVASRTGAESSVTLDRDVDLRLLAQGAALVLVHNHPHDASLSENDLVQLSKPGVAAVVAIAHDKSIYIAARGPRYDIQRFEDLQYLPVRAEVAKRLRIECGARAISQPSADAHFSHIVMVALAKTRVIEYQAVFSPVARDTFEPARIAFNRVAVGASARR